MAGAFPSRPAVSKHFMITLNVRGELQIYTQSNIFVEKISFELMNEKLLHSFFLR